MTSAEKRALCRALTCSSLRELLLPSEEPPLCLESELRLSVQQPGVLGAAQLEGPSE